MPVDAIVKVGQEIIAAYKKEFNDEKVPIDDFIKKMASKFEVSQDAMKYGLANLEIIKKD